MKTSMLTRRWLASWHLIAALTLAGGAAFAAHYSSLNNDSDILGVAAYTDPLCVNPWGLVTGVAGNLHVSDEATGFSTLYDPSGHLINFAAGTSGTFHAIAIPSLSATASPTGIADNQQALLSTKTDPHDFLITSGTVTKSSHFIYCTEDGFIAGYNPNVDPSAAITGTSVANAGYTGCALSWTGTGTKISGLNHQLYAADFAQGTIDVFDNSFVEVTATATNPWVDPNPPAAPAGTAWSPFNIHTLDYFGRAHETDPKQATQRLLIVTYALHSTTTDVLNDIPQTSGTNNGFVDIFRTDGSFVKRLANTAGDLSSPWGVAVAHSPLPEFGAPVVILIGSHGTGTIDAYAIDPKFPDLDKHLGTVKKDDGTPLAFDGLWALRFGVRPVKIGDYIATDGQDIFEDIHHLYFSAGIVDETHGLVGRIVLP
jgi:uncharacterized protein (TIGR03118 family)